ncbi:DUF1232 domain-containing protein [Clostridium sp. SYSU_GA19001]|uniref:YkvA family protein n=1 Tax=Clostridium caldaquaticum TaxID=2940653 RepID=UPI002076F2DC|nr:DUF1232 domain-containing protein [Clostridium caldaquaticum]MCM8711164.1 DUF1232 domain-containing protein [Clostridium caldaquaticum]
MKVTSGKIRLTSKDILEAVNEYIKIDNLKIEDIKINELITVNGSYKKKVEIPFRASIGLGSIKDNKITIKILDFKAFKVGILPSIKNFALKTFLKDFDKDGITVNKDNLIVDVNVISKLVPFVYFKLKSADLLKDAIEVEVEDILYAPDKETMEFNKKKQEFNQEIYKLQDGYSKIREDIKKKVPDKYKNIAEYAMVIPDIAALLWRLFKDKRVDIKTKILVGGLIAYLASPIDILPDFIPLIGRIDDVAIVFFAMNKLINEIPEEIILSNWIGREDIIKLIKDGVDFIGKMVGSQNVGKLLDYIKKISLRATNEEKQNEKRNNIH